MIESHEKADTIYSLWTCEGKVVYEREDKPIQKIYPEMNVKIDRRFCSVYPMWEEEDTDGFECENVNPYTLPLIKKYLDELLSSYMTGCRTGIRISQFIYRDSKGIFSEGIGFRFSKISSWSRTEVYVNCLNEHLFSFAYGANENFYNMEHSEHINIEKYKIIFTLD